MLATSTAPRSTAASTAAAAEAATAQPLALVKRCAHNERTGLCYARGKEHCALPQLGESLRNFTPTSPVACPATLNADTRLWLTLNAHAYHGSTALFQLALSSPAAASICSAGSWQCEARGDSWKGDKVKLSRQDTTDALGPIPRVQLDFMREAEVLANFWDLRKEIFISKWVPLTV